MQTIEAMHDKPGAPLAYRHPAHTETLGDFDVRATLGAGQHNPAPQRQRLRARMAPSPTLERVALAVAEHQLGHPCAPLSHRCLPSSSMTTTGTRPRTPKFLTAHETPTQITRRAEPVNASTRPIRRSARDRVGQAPVTERAVPPLAGSCPPTPADGCATPRVMPSAAAHVARAWRDRPRCGCSRPFTPGPLPCPTSAWTTRTWPDAIRRTSARLRTNRLDVRRQRHRHPARRRVPQPDRRRRRPCAFQHLHRRQQPAPPSVPTRLTAGAVAAAGTGAPGGSVSGSSRLVVTPPRRAARAGPGMGAGLPRGARLAAARRCGRRRCCRACGSVRRGRSGAGRRRR